MKSFYSVVAVAVVFALCGTSSAVVLFQDDFESGVVGQDLFTQGYIYDGGGGKAYSATVIDSGQSTTLLHSQDTYAVKPTLTSVNLADLAAGEVVRLEFVGASIGGDAVSTVHIFNESGSRYMGLGMDDNRDAAGLNIFHFLWQEDN